MPDLLESLDRGLIPETLVDLVPLVHGATVPSWKHLPPGPVAVIEPETVAQEAEGFWSRAVEDWQRRAGGDAPRPEDLLVTPKALADRLGAGPLLEVREVDTSDSALHVAVRPAPTYAGDVQRLVGDLR